MAHQQGPIDIVAVNDDGDIYFIDVKTDGKRITGTGIKPSRIHRIRSSQQKKLNVILAYVDKENNIEFITDLITKGVLNGFNK
tara:strand:+ start:8165 stop:8413 length:249 start_codon:yes stop_codon:yes gene_type:complete